MWTDGVVLTVLGFNQNLRVLQGVENLPVQEFVTHTGVEVFDLAVLPGAARVM
jgi:hypothetical protein